MLDILAKNPIEFIIIAALLVAAISIHEFSHALAADHLGDPTPRIAGRLTLNPKAHLDPLGTVLLFLFGFGWGKPVPFDPFNLREPFHFDYGNHIGHYPQVYNHSSFANSQCFYFGYSFNVYLL